MAEPQSHTLTRLTGKGADLAKALQNKHFKRLVERESRTTRLALQERRLRLEAKNQFVANNIKMLVEGKVEDGERERIVNITNLITMHGMLEGLGLIVDCLTRVYTKSRTDKETGETITGKKRVSVAENLEDVHDMLIDTLQLLDIDVNIVNDIGLRLNTWRDEHGVNRSPYLRDEDNEFVDGEEVERQRREAEDPEVVTDAQEQQIMDNAVGVDGIDGTAEPKRKGNEEE